jgi:hypothetical protein
MSMSPTLSAFKSAFLRRAALLSAIAWFIGTAFPQQASAQLTFTPPNTGDQTGDNIANLGSPTWVQDLVPNAVIVYYVNHSDYKIMVDGVAGVNLGHPEYVYNPQGSQIAVWNAEFTDVGAAVIYPCGSSTCPTMLINYVDPSQNVHFLTSTDMVHFTTDVIPSASALGIGNQSAYPQLVPGLYSPNNATQPANCRGCAYVATIGNSDRLVYVATTFDGVNFSPLYGNGMAVSEWTTVSRPSMVYSPTNGDTLIGFTSDGAGYTRVAFIGAVSGLRWPPAGMRTDISWGNSNRNGNYAGLSLVEYNGNLWVFGQDTASSHYLKYMYTADSNSPLCCFSAAVFPGNFQLRFTPSTILFNSAIYWIKQDDASTGIAWGYAR